MLLQENAALLLSKLAKDPKLREGHAPYWASLPPPNTTVFCKLLFTPEHKHMLQNADLVRETLPPEALAPHACLHCSASFPYCMQMLWVCVRWCGHPYMQC